MKVRIGIDVGGTFTDAVAINNETYELIGAEKIPTTHNAPEGVAAGIIQVLQKIMELHNIAAEDVTFIAHGTTQATNALLEGDVARVGIVTLGSGIEGKKAQSDTNIGDIPLAAGKNLCTVNAFVNTADSNAMQSAIRAALQELKEKGADAIVATEAFSVDRPENENLVVDLAAEEQIPATAGNEVSKLYGLKIRTRTAVVNASIMPKMLDAANMTEHSIQNAGIESPLMVMRCDGGVMTVDEVRNRPIMTILSGPAAGVAGALMYEKLTDGIFLEVGGTSTDISCVKDGNVMIKYAEVGGHKTYLNSLDVRTVGIGGGSMIGLTDGRITSVGPRSAHIAKMAYEVYAKTEEIVSPKLIAVRPMETDNDYAAIECADGSRFALTLSGAANICGYVSETDYAHGNVEAAKVAWQPLADRMGLSVEETARLALTFAAKTNGATIDGLIKDYGLDVKALTFVGGGGGASAVVPHLAETYGVRYKQAKNAEVISPIGVALAMVRDVVERTISKPTEEDILSLRKEAVRAAIRSGAAPDSIEVKIEVDGRLNKVRAIAIGTTELRTKNLGAEKKSIDELRAIVAENLAVAAEDVELIADNGDMVAFVHTAIIKKFLMKKTVRSIRIIDKDGVIRLQRRNADVASCTVAGWRKTVKRLLNEHTIYGDGGAEMPNLYIFHGLKMIDLASLPSDKQILALCDVELAGAEAEDQLLIVCTKTVENERK